jgi:hypothetical protein
MSKIAIVEETLLVSQSEAVMSLVVHLSIDRDVKFTTLIKPHG